MNLNKVVKILIYSDVIVVTAFALYLPIFAIFIAGEIEGGGPLVAGLAAAIYWVVRSVIQLPISKYLDRHDGERDDFWALIIGSFIFSTVPLLYLFAEVPWHVYVLQAIYGVGDSLAVPTYLAMYGRHVDKNKEGSEWGLRSVSVGVGAALAGAGGGLLADKFGFETVFIVTSVLAFTGSFILAGLYKYMSPRRRGGVNSKIVPPVKGHGH